MKHGHALASKRSSTYATWAAMIQRCNNPRAQNYKNYGGRGIKVCKKWLKFENFLADMGERPAGLTLDRRNNNGNYHKRNCRWTTHAIQNTNKRPQKGRQFFTYKGETLYVSEWARKLGFSRTLMGQRFKRWPVKEAITLPRGARFVDATEV